jgi:hypothetical protein
VTAYRRHIWVTDEELNRLDGVMGIRPLYLMGLDYRWHRPAPWRPGPAVRPDYIKAAAAATRAVFGR